MTGPARPLPPAAYWVAGARLVLARPGLWATAIRQVWRLARPRWWRRRPFLPLPDPDYLRFRLETQYGGGSGDAPPDPHDLVDYLEWCRELAASAGHRGGRR
jgi:hypothetical protein